MALPVGPLFGCYVTSFLVLSVFGVLLLTRGSDGFGIVILGVKWDRA